MKSLGNMTKEEKDLLILDLSARSPYNVKVHNITFKDPQIQTLKGVIGDECVMQETYLETSGHSVSRTKNYSGLIEFVKPYLRPMSSMTEEEKKEMLAIFEQPCENPRLEVDEYCSITYTKYAESHRVIDMYYDAEQQAEWLDWLNKHHFDYRGLIPKGLALEAPE